jgi:hypothetical protein
MDSPLNHIWGPQLWIILHSSAEKIGSQQLKRLPQEETRIWTTLLSSLRYSLPCPQCKKHYTEFLSSNPITSVERTNIRNWLFNLHNQVSIRNGKQTEITIEQLSELYNKPFNFSAHFKIVTDQMIKAMRLGWCSRTDIQRSIRLFEELKRFYDFF